MPSTSKLSKKEEVRLPLVAVQFALSGVSWSLSLIQASASLTVLSWCCAV